jgi:hypothetical protein
MAILCPKGHKLTPTEAAKRIAMEAADRAPAYAEPHGTYVVQADKFTAAEQKKVDAALMKQLTRIARLLRQP